MKTEFQSERNYLLTNLHAVFCVPQPEGLVNAGIADANPCFDTQVLGGSGAGWAGTYIPMQLLQRFINRQTAAIKRADPKVIVTLGSWSERAQTDELGWRNYYKDKCVY